MIFKYVLQCFPLMSSILFLFAFPCLSQQPAFPTAEGFGRFAAGGRGGDVYHVTNLNDDGTGSLRYGVEKMNGPRTIVFDVSGTIALNDRLKVENSNITIAGQTAPGDGITLAGDDFNVSASNVIIRYIRCRLGDDSGGDDDAVHINSGSNIIFDHVTASWSIDETFSFQSAEIDSLTVQWCMITESLRYSHHKKGAHGYGGIIGGLRQTVHHNLYAHHSSRSPKVSGRRHCKVDFRNNVIYNWGYNNCYDGTASYLNWANNYYKAGPGTESGVRYRIFQLSDEDIPPGGNNSPEDSQNYETSLYAEGNYVDGYPAVTADNWSGGIDFYDGATEAKNRVTDPFDFPAITEQTAEEAYPLVVESAGASFTRDEIDERIVNEVITGTVTYGNDGIIDSQDDVGGVPVHYTFTPPQDNDQDGMPDYWETQYRFNLNDPADNNLDNDADGYSNIEEYLNNTNPVDNGKPVVFLQTMNSRATESKPGIIIFRRNGDISNALTVPFSVNSTSVSGIDYQALPESITFQAGEKKVELNIHAINDNNNENVEFVHVTLATGSEKYYAGCPSTNYIAIQASVISHIAQMKKTTPHDFNLNNYPNPFNPSTTLMFTLKQSGLTRLSIYNINGQWMETLIYDHLESGRHEKQWNAGQLASGVYFYKLETNQQIVIRKMLLMQ